MLKGQMTTKNNETKEPKGRSRKLPGVQDCHIMAIMLAIVGHRNAVRLWSYTKSTSAQRAQMAAILDGEEEDQFDKLDLALEKASKNDQEKLERHSAPVHPLSMPVVQHSNHSISLHRH